ncbi:MAG: DUF1289 domain-containing protein [Paracoccaceae bacterium]
MTDEIWSRDEIESPCDKICMIHPDTRLCIGCKRTGDEISRWSRMSPEERRAVMLELPDRNAGPARRTGGRQARIKRNGAT